MVILPSCGRETQRRLELTAKCFGSLSQEEENTLPQNNKGLLFELFSTTVVFGIRS